MKKILSLFCLIVFSAANAFSSENRVDMELKEAKIYLSGAELGFVSEARINKGINKIKLYNLTKNILENSIRVNAGANVQILSVTLLSDKDILEDTGDEINSKKDSIENIDYKISTISNEKTALTEELEMIKANRSFSGNSTLSAAQLKEMADFYRSRVKEINDMILDIDIKLRDFNKEKSAMNQRYHKLMNKHSQQPLSVIEVEIESESAGNIPLYLTCFDYTACWRPEYDFRVSEIGANPEIIYKAKVMQNTGIDWINTELTLSTGRPELSLSVPELNSIKAIFSEDATQIIEVLTGGFSAEYGEAMPGIYNTIPSRSPGGPNVFNTAPHNPYIVPEEKQIRVDALDQGGRFGTDNLQAVDINFGYLNLEYTPEHSYSIPSDTEYHSVIMRKKEAKASYEYYSAPSLSEKAYLLAKMKEGQGLQLYAGEANVYFEHTYTGKTFINPTGRDSVLSVPVAVDNKVSVKRENSSSYSKDFFLSSDVERKYAYDITIKNNKKTEVKIIVEDRIPVSTDDDIEIELLEKSGAKFNKIKGILTWEITLKPLEKITKTFAYKITNPEDREVFIGVN